MSHAHQHPQACEHEMKHCGHCDVAYCARCNKEWGIKSQTNAPWPYNPVPMPLGPFYSGGTGDIALCNAIAGETGQRGVFHRSHEMKETLGLI